MDDLFKPALKSLGPLKSDEMYGFVPALHSADRWN
ncbi:hypothetical protein ALP59_05320 [Pseudomonas savastanoi]|uniref:T6SS immunity protein Tdi1 C-terminal domain-containing protein n=1 Tax=Pseudomonas savastanoi TaxID=29438 RepID=A0A3M5G8Z6_PSESS|nr:hypothetical protein ALP59_05320 [Pseudomonas savastanoi]